MLRTLRGRCLWLVNLVPMVIGLVALGGLTVTTGIGIAVWLMGMVGWAAGVVANDLRNWPNWILVPGYCETLFRMLIAVLLLVPLACGILWTMVMSPLPPFGPGLLLGALMTLWVVRSGVRPAVLVAGAGIFGLAFYLMWAARQQMHPAVFESLTDLHVQFPALALAALALFSIRRALTAPLRLKIPDFDAVRPRYSKLIGLIGGPRARLRREVVASLPLVVLALLLVLLVRTGFTTYSVGVVFPLACLTYANLRVVGRLTTIHFPLRSLWLSGTVETRNSLGRKSARVILVRGLGWLPAGLVGATILAFGVQQTSHLDGVFLIALATLLALALFIGNVKRIPATRESWGLIVVATCGGTSATLIHFVELGWAGRSALVLGVAGLAGATWYAVARALARAEIVQ